MIRHLITLIWNRKRSLVWIFVEQALVFCVLLFGFTSVAEDIIKFNSKGNPRVENVVFIAFNELKKESSEEEKDTYKEQFRNMVEGIREWPSVEFVSITRDGAIPISASHYIDSLRFRERSYKAYIKYCDENYYRIFAPHLSEGQWFDEANSSEETPPALITQKMADDMGLTGSAIGQMVTFHNRTHRIIGVVEAFKERRKDEPQAVLFMPISSSDERDRGWEYVVKHKQGMHADFIKAFMAAFYKYFSRDELKPEIVNLFKFGKQMDFITATIKFYLAMIPTAFLVIFAFLGTFGLVWMQTKKRMGELGLRIALGSTPARLRRTIIAENLLLTAFAMIPGLIVMANLYAFAPKGWEWLAAVGAAILLMFIFAAFSAWYPARQASKIQPVEALRSNQ